MKFNKILPHLIAVVVFVVAVFTVFSPQFSGKSLRSGDIASNRASAKEMMDYKEATGDRATWTNTSFGGMPTYQLSTIRDGNQLELLFKPLRGFLPGPAGTFFLGMLCCYLFLILLGADPWLSIVAAVATGLATTLLVVYVAGHSSKTVTIFYLPLVAAGALLAFRKRYLLGGLVFAVGMGLAIMANHPQMLFYFGLTFPILGIAQLVSAIRAGELPHFAKALGVLVVGLLLAIAAGASNIMTTLDYTPASMRGGQVLETPLANETSGTDGTVPENGLSWDYAMRWSNNAKDILATYAPLAAGGGFGHSFKEDNEYAAAFKKANFGAPAANQVPSYHGGKIEGTAGPEYLGAVVWALFIFGLFTARRRVAVWLGLGTLLVIMLSMGKYLPAFNQTLYDLIPLLNKFRAPSSALNVLPFMMASLGILGVDRWLRVREESPEVATNQLKYAGIAAVAFGLSVLFLFPAVLGFDSVTDANLSGQITQALQNAKQPTAQITSTVNNILDGLEASRRAIYMGDAWRSFLFVGLTFGVLLLLWKKIVNPMVGALLLLGLLVVDLSGINGRYLDKNNWTNARNQYVVQPTPADQQILADQEPGFRVLNQTTSTWNDAATSYHHRSIGGYSAVKMRRYQDLITFALGNQNATGAEPAVLDMLNAKYVIRNPQQAERRPTAYGPAWLAGKINIVNSNDAELQALKSTPDLKTNAFVHEEFADAVAGLNPTGQGTIQLTEHGPMELRYSFNSPAEQLAVFSEMWYGPDKGWTATIDGQPAELIRANYVLRALRVPAGQHEIVMTFAPTSYSTGKAISLIASLLILIGLLGYAFYFGYWKKRTAGE